MTDIADSTRLWEHHPDTMGTVVSGHNTIVAARVSRRGGRLVKSTGDGALAVFAEARDAVAAAVDIQRDIVGRVWPEVGELRVRIGLDTGVCHHVAGDVLGRPPNLASRLQSAGHGGQILATGATAAACAGRLSGTIGLREVGPYLIRGFDEPISIFMVTHPALPPTFPPLRAPPVGLDDVPTDDVELFGRDDLLAAIPAWLDEYRVVTLWGPPGVGKSRVAIRVARTTRRPFDDGVRFVDLSRGPSDDIDSALVAALRAQPNAGESTRETVLRTLGPLRVMLVVVHCERVLDQLRDVVVAIAEGCPYVRLLATSSEALGCAGERSVEVRPLPVPRDGERSPSELLTNPAARLFMARLRASGADFHLHPSNAALVAEACRLADGLPLALELAAAHAEIEGLAAPQLVPASLTARVTEQLGRVDPADAILLSHLAVFSGPFNRDLAAAIAPDPDRVGSSLEHLVRSALVHVDTTAIDRFRLLRPCRHAAWDALPPPARDALRWRHARVMVERAALFEPLLRTGEQAVAVQAINSGFAEFRTAVQFLLDQGTVDEAGALVTRLFQFCLFQPRPEGHRWALEVARRVETLDGLGVHVLGAAALASWFAGDMTNAIDLGKRSVAAAAGTTGGAEAGAGASTVWARTALVNALGYVGDLPNVVPHFGALVAELRRSDDPYWRINGLGYEAISLSMFGRGDDAVAKADHALDLARDLGNPDAKHWALYALGRATARADPHSAAEAYQQAMMAAHQVGSGFNVGLDLVEWVGLQRLLDRPELAARGAGDLLDLVAVSGNRAQLSQAILEVGLVLAHAGAVEPAAMALLSRRGLPTMPTGSAESADTECLDRIARELGSAWSSVRVRARALDEADLVDLCRTELADLSERL